MKKFIFIFAFVGMFVISYAQVDTISTNLYQYNGHIGIGRVFTGGYFNAGLNVHNSWLQISDSTDHDCGLVISHLKREGYGFARSLHMVYEGVAGDPYTEFRIRSSQDVYTRTSWAFGACNQDDDKLVISNAINTYTGASPLLGYRVMVFNTTGEVGIGTSFPQAKLEIADGDIFISDIDRGIIMKSPDGNCWRGTLDNSGKLIFQMIDCFDILTLTPLQSNMEEPIRIYPNPAGRELVIDFVEGMPETCSFQISSMSGSIVKSGSLSGGTRRIDLSGIAAGTYLLNIMDANGTTMYTGKLVRQ